MSGWTKKVVIDTAWAEGIPEDKALEFYHHYNAQDWLFGNGLKITNLASALVRWKNNQYRFAKEKKKTKLPVIIGKTCSVKGCKLPAVYKDTSGSYDHYKCSKHLPKNVKEQFE